MTEAVWIAIIGCAQAIMLAMLGMIAKSSASAKKDSAAAREHVENSHIDRMTGQPYNLRDNIDNNQNELLREIRGVRIELGRVDQRAIAVEADVRQVRAELGQQIAWSRGQEGRIDSQEDRLGHLENTLNPKEQ